MWNESLRELYVQEINIHLLITDQLDFAEKELRLFNEYLDPNYVLNLWIPLAGAFSQKLLAQLVTSIALINTLTSVVKWCIPEHRPLWWIKENDDFAKYMYFRALKPDPFICETTAGLPSSITADFTAFTFIVFWHFLETFCPPSDSDFIDKYVIMHGVLSVLVTFVAFTRLYFLHEFLHQCLVGTFIAIFVVKRLKKYSGHVLNIRRTKALKLVILCSLVPISVYYAMLYLDVDPLWSVRMAFKWCPDPLNLKHETSPVFILYRDFGYLLGVALSCPLFKNYTNTSTNYFKRIPVLSLMQILNSFARSCTPKQYGRYVFVGYELLRNCLHSYMLLSVLPKISNN